MFASGSSPPPQDFDASISAATSAPDTPAPIAASNGGNNQHTSTAPAATAPSRKRNNAMGVGTLDRERKY
ncbi:hypothetical protein NMY22_g17738 [Coprinellus aureogranulatus]|nr:hypothetical protein NMY22_g17738 [Coprinellus aureogranulatus]